MNHTVTKKRPRVNACPQELSVTEMYRLYNVWRVKKGYPHEAYPFYHLVFKERFNLKFQKAKRDQCDTCEAFKSYPVENVIHEIKLAHENRL